MQQRKDTDKNLVNRMNGYAEKRLNILLLFLLLGVISMLLWVHSAIYTSAKDLLDAEDKQYQIYRKERLEDFKTFTSQSINLLSSNLEKIRADEDSILNDLNSKVEQTSKKVEETVKKADTTPKVIEKTIEHHTEVISDSELKRREKVKEQAVEAQQKYLRDTADWNAKYGKKNPRKHN